MCLSLIRSYNSSITDAELAATMHVFDYIIFAMLGLVGLALTLPIPSDSTIAPVDENFEPPTPGNDLRV